MPKSMLFHWLLLQIWLIKKSCNLIGWEYFYSGISRVFQMLVYWFEHPNLVPKIKRELMENNINNLIISSMQMLLCVLKHLSKTLKNVELKTLWMPGSAAHACLNYHFCFYKQLNYHFCFYKRIVSINDSNISVPQVCPN